jgi:hypothetical protein
MDGPELMTKPSYRQTFRQHRRLLTLPIVLAVVIAGWFVLGASKSYQSTASLWVDNPAATDSSLGNANPALVPPSTQEQSVLTELLATQSFVLAVAHHGGLAQYLATHSSSGFSPTALLSGGGGSLNARIVGAFGPKQVVSAIPGPQVLKITYQGPTPAVTTSTLSALVSQLQQDSDKFSQQRNAGVIAYFKAQVAAAAKEVATARAQVTAYEAQHPQAGSSDTNLNALQTAAGAANSQLTQATQKLNDAAGSGADSGSNGSTLQLIDPPSAATSASSKKKALLGIVGGLFAGCLISFLGAVALTPGKRDSWDADVPAGVAPHHAPTPQHAPTSLQNGYSAEEAASADGGYSDAPAPSSEDWAENGEALAVNGEGDAANGEAPANDGEARARNRTAHPGRAGDRPPRGTRILVTRRFMDEPTRDGP